MSECVEDNEPEMGHWEEGGREADFRDFHATWIQKCEAHFLHGNGETCISFGNKS